MFIDETGNFEEPSASVAVVGWLVQHREVPHFDQHLRSALAKVVPDGAWPPHASVLNLPISQAVVFRLFGFAEVEKERWKSAAPALWQALSELQHPAVQEVVRLADHGVFAPYDTLKEANEALREHAPGTLRRLTAQRGSQAHRMACLLACLRETFEPGESWLVGAFEPGAAASTDDRYLAVLEALFGRVLGVLRSADDVVHHVKTIVARRHVQVDGIPRVIQLRNQDVGDCIRRAESFPLLAPPSGTPDQRVRIVPWGVTRYDELVRPGVVIADFAANRLRWPLSSAASWRELRSQADVRAVLPVDAPPRMDPGTALPTMAATGAAASAIVDAFSRKTPVAVPGTTPGWAADQAEQWVNAMARWA